MSIVIERVNCQFEREPLVRPFGFKGGYVTQLWQIVALIESRDGERGLGLGTQNVLWSGPEVFASTSESGANAMMFAITAHALRLVRGRTFNTPIDLQDAIFEEVHEYARRVTNQPELNKTFTLNALVPVDNAAWMLYARRSGVTDFDSMIPVEYRKTLASRHSKVASIPIASYGMPLDEVTRLVTRDGYFFLKFKLGAPGTQETMLAKDRDRITEIHRAIGSTEVAHTSDGRFPYYFDMNGRYQSKALLEELLAHTRAIGAFEQIRIVEEPFPEDYRVEVGDLGVTVAADESAHTAGNVEERIDLGYGAIALKPVAKTLSTTLKMAEAARKRSIPCFCADLTVNPVLLEWNRSVASRLAPLPGFEIGLLETNGHQNYKNWERMVTYHPRPDASWVTPDNGVFHLDKDFFQSGGGALEESSHYASLVDAEMQGKD